MSESICFADFELFSTYFRKNIIIAVALSNAEIAKSTINELNVFAKNKRYRGLIYNRTHILHE